MPDYTVIAGPNEAGKSTFSALLAHPNTLIFDPDKERAKVERSYPDISEEAVDIFSCYWEISHSFERVNIRIAQKGHFVDQESIRYNYKESLLNLYKVADQFDHLLLMDGSIKEDQSPPLLLATFKDKSLNYQNEEMPGWTIRPFSNIKLALNNANKKDLSTDIQR